MLALHMFHSAQHQQGTLLDVGKLIEVARHQAGHVTRSQSQLEAASQ